VFAETWASHPHELIDFDPVKGLVNAPRKAHRSFEYREIFRLMIGLIESEPHDILVSTLVVVVKLVVADGLMRVVKFTNGQMEGACNVLAIQMLRHFEMVFVAVFKRGSLQLFVGNLILVLKLIGIIKWFTTLFERKAEELSSKLHGLFGVLFRNNWVVLGPVFENKESFIKEFGIVSL
jgi:hypothetical protein